VPFIGAEGERDGRTVEGNDRRQWSAMMVVEAAVSRGDWLGSGAPAISEAEGGGAPACGARAPKATVAALAGWPREEDDRAGWAGWAGQRPRPSGGLAAMTQKEGKESGPAGVEGEAGCGWAESGVGPEFKRNCFQISIDFRIWQNFGNLHIEI
jgi:hypothetical protein